MIFGIVFGIHKDMLYIFLVKAQTISGKDMMLLFSRKGTQLHKCALIALGSRPVTNSSQGFFLQAAAAAGIVLHADYVVINLALKL